MIHTKNILDIKPTELKQIIKELGFSSYRSTQIYDAIFKNLIFNPSAISSLPIKLRTQIKKIFNWTMPKIQKHVQSNDQTYKFLFKGYDNNYWETVLMTYHNRITLCVSSQIGCRLGCKFCQTGALGFVRDLLCSEILAQYFESNKYYHNYILPYINDKITHINTTHNIPKHISNIVFMGMGEPLNNYDNTLQSIYFLISEKYLNLSYKHVTISTAGIVPAIYKLADEKIHPTLAISLNTADEELRNQLMPINKKYPLSELKKSLVYFQQKTKQQITIEYVLISKINSDNIHMKKLLKFLTGLKAKINLIPYNYNPRFNYQAPNKTEIHNFVNYFKKRKYPITIRYSKGYDILGACGQLINQLHY